MFDKVTFELSEEDKAIAAYKFLLEAILASREANDSLKEEARVEYDKYFWSDDE
jgi:hypothetical protein